MKDDWLRGFVSRFDAPGSCESALRELDGRGPAAARVLPALIDLLESPSVPVDRILHTIDNIASPLGEETWEICEWLLKTFREKGTCTSSRACSKGRALQPTCIVRDTKPRTMAEFLATCRRWRSCYPGSGRWTNIENGMIEQAERDCCFRSPRLPSRLCR